MLSGKLPKAVVDQRMASMNNEVVSPFDFPMGEFQLF